MKLLENVSHFSWKLFVVRILTWRNDSTFSKVKDKREGKIMTTRLNPSWSDADSLISCWARAEQTKEREKKTMSSSSRSWLCFLETVNSSQWQPWWRRRESNPRPRTFSSKPLHAYPLLYSRRARLEEEKPCSTSLENFSLLRVGAALTRYPARRRFPRTAGENPGNGMPIV